MNLTTPEWLARHDGELRACLDGWVVFFDHEPQYRLTPLPAEGKFACKEMQTINGRRLDRGGVYPTEEDAVRGGLEDLRKALGW